MTEAPYQRIASYAFITAENHVLLSLLNRGPNAGKWGLIGGKIEFGESPKEALIRELKEEAGIELDASIEPELFDVFSYRYDDQIHFIGIVHLISLPKMLECKKDGDGFSSDGTRWFALDRLNTEHANELNPSVTKILKKLYS